MALKDTITESYNNCVAATLTEKLLAEGFIQAQIDEIIASYTNNNSTAVVVSNAVDNSLNNTSSIATITANQTVKKEAQATKTALEKKINSIHNPQEASESVKWTEPVMSETKMTSPKDLQDANYTVDEDYPNSYGMIDSVGNWFKVNKVTKYAEFVHSSGSAIKVDKDGNTTIHIKGKLKLIIDKDFSLEVVGAMDNIVGNGLYEHIGGEKEVNVDANYKINAVANLIMKAATIMEN